MLQPAFPRQVTQASGAPEPAEPPPPPPSVMEVTIRDVQDFFVNYIKNDNLGQIANAHMIHADISPIGALCAECLELAALHSTAVDFLKTGVPAQFPPRLRTSKSPSFMNQSYKQQYESTKVLGRMHKMIEDEMRGHDGWELSGRAVYKLVCDPKFLYPGYEMYIQDAFDCMVEYNAGLWSIMKRFGVYCEGELLSGFVTKFSKRFSRNGGKGE